MMAIMMKKLTTVAAFLLSGCGCTVVGTGERGIQTRFGEIQGEPLPEGLHWYNPITSSIKRLDVRETKLESSTKPYTKDTQTAEIHYTITYAPDASQIHLLYKNLGEDWAEKIVKPVVEDTIQSVIGSEAADDLMGHREAIRQMIFNKLQGILKGRSVTIRQLALTNVDFDDAYEKAVEAKVVAIQHAAEAKNKTVEIEEKAKQSLIAAEAEAKSMSIRSQALSQNKSLVDYEAVQKWDGKLPQYMMGATTPFIRLGESK
jgi:prohibitin 2